MKIIASIIVSWLAVGSAVAQDSQVRATVVTTGTIWEGSKVVLAVELKAPGYFADTAVFDLPTVPGALILPPGSSPTVGSETVGDQTFVTQRHEIGVYPHRAGDVDIPSFGIRFSIKRSPLDHDTVAQTVKTQPIRITVKRPPGFLPDENIITSTDLEITESWKSEPVTDAKTGDAFVRTVHWSASDLTGIAFPPFPGEKIHGLAVYHSTPLVEDRSERGQTSGQRTETFTYVCKAAGTIVIPPVTMRWWDPSSEKIRSVTFPVHTLSVTAPPPPPESASDRFRKFLHRHAGSLVTGVASFMLLGLIAFFTRRRIGNWLQRLRPTHLPPLNPGPTA